MKYFHFYFGVIILYIILNTFLFEGKKISEAEGTIKLKHKNYTFTYLSLKNHSLRHNYLNAPKYKINTCINGKSLSSISFAIFCYLFDSRMFLKDFKAKNNNDINNRHICYHRNYFTSMDSMIKRYAGGDENQFFDEWKNILIIRDPISRFISGFVHLCVVRYYELRFYDLCYKCNKSMKCFLNKLYYEAKTFRTIRTNDDRSMVYHFFPQKWQCEYEKYKKNYAVVRYTNDRKKFYKEYLTELKKHNIPDEKTVFIKKLFYKTKSNHMTRGIPATTFYTRHLTKSPSLLKLLLRMYYDDFKEFNFTLPKI
uniref:Sulfotransfer_1 domain-containing protein n=1 Tax=Parastrongyloides trichosuri TaxID=131310 RepID=A0A0N5A3A0_PARTI